MRSIHVNREREKESNARKVGTVTNLVYERPSDASHRTVNNATPTAPALARAMRVESLEVRLQAFILLRSVVVKIEI